MANKTAKELPWERPFLAALAQGLSAKKAARTAGIAESTPFGRRKRSAQLADEWSRVLLARASVPAKPTAKRTTSWKAAFFDALAETSNVTAAAATANAPTRTVYKLRREDPVFAAAWLAALREGYDNLEMELLGYLRDPRPGRKMDVASALRLLAAHRDTVARERAVRNEEDEAAVLDSIDTFLEDMRQRRLANTAILIEAEPGDGDE